MHSHKHMQAGHKDVRDAIVAIVLGQNQTLEEKHNFEQYFGLGSVAEWSSRMEKEFAWGTPMLLCVSKCLNRNSI